MSTAAGIQTLVVAGVSLSITIPNLVFDAVNAEYQVVVADAVAATPVDYVQGRTRAFALVATPANTDVTVAEWQRALR